MKKHKGLGKGLDAILPAEIVEDIFGEQPHGEKLREIHISKIIPNPLQPREEFDGAAIEELAESIKAQGILQPVLVAVDGDNYILIAGERRWRAAQIAGLDKIPAIILDEKPSEQKLLFLALVENLQREDLDPVEEATAFRMLSEEYNLTQEEIAEKVGKSRPAITNAIRLLRLPAQALKLLREKKITAGHARVLLEEKDTKRIIRLAQLTARRGLSVERLAILVMSKAKQKRRIKKAQKTPEILALEDELALVLGTPVEINIGKKKGKLVIEFYNDDELKELVRKLGGI